MSSLVTNSLGARPVLHTTRPHGSFPSPFKWTWSLCTAMEIVNRSDLNDILVPFNGKWAFCSWTPTSYCKVSSEVQLFQKEAFKCAKVKVRLQWKGTGTQEGEYNLKKTSENPNSLVLQSKRKFKRKFKALISIGNHAMTYLMSKLGTIFTNISAITL